MEHCWSGIWAERVCLGTFPLLDLRWVGSVRPGRSYVRLSWSHWRCGRCWNPRFSLAGGSFPSVAAVRRLGAPWGGKVLGGGGGGAISVVRRFASRASASLSCERSDCINLLFTRIHLGLSRLVRVLEVRVARLFRLESFPGERPLLLKCLPG